MSFLFNILVINPGSTSTKLALFHNETLVTQQNVPLAAAVAKLPLLEQLSPRLALIHDFIQTHHIERIDAVAGRGGLLKPITNGVYTINETMLDDARNGVQGLHPANLGCLLARSIADEWRCDAFVVDPVSIDEFAPVARYSGHPLIQRRTLAHALNIRAVARTAASDLNLQIESANFVVAHLGGGISIAAVQGGRIVDVNDASSDGPFSPERSGSLPMQQFADLCFSGKFSREEVKKMIMGEGGLKAYLGSSDVTQVEEKAKSGDKKAAEVLDAMIYQIAKEIGAMSTVLAGEVAAVVLTGGLANSQRVVDGIKKRVQFIAPVRIYPGEFEMSALAAGVTRVLTNQEEAKIYR